MGTKMSRPFIYDEKTSILYDPNGNYIKHVYCPKAKVWNQLINDDPSSKTRFCETCSGRVINLDATPPAESLALLKADPNTCIFAGKKSPNVIYLRPDDGLSPSFYSADHFYEESNKNNLRELRISTDLTEINAAAGAHYWPDVVHSVSISLTNEILRHFQDEFGYVSLLSDSGNLMDEDLKRIYSSDSIATPYLEFSIAAYLIPRGTKNGDHFFIKNPIAARNYISAVEWWSAEATFQNRKMVIDESTLTFQYITIG
jgi:hypothetical protein